MNDDNENTQHLLSEARSGSQASMGRLAGIVRERLYSFVFRTTLDHDMTEDVLQETLLSMVRHIDRLREKRKFWPWVFRIAYNKLQDSLRARRNQSSAKAHVSRVSPRRCSGQACPRSEGETPSTRLYEARAGNSSLLEEAIHAERLQQLSELVKQLSRQHRDILRLRYYEQLPYTKIAALTSTTPQKARARFHRAKKHLKAQMKDDTQHGTPVVV
jgi:RNA polymerase sigma-70 factor (ECF subfamily)